MRTSRHALSSSAYPLRRAIRIPLCGSVRGVARDGRGDGVRSGVHTSRGSGRTFRAGQQQMTDQTMLSRSVTKERSSEVLTPVFVGVLIGDAIGLVLFYRGVYSNLAIGLPIATLSGGTVGYMIGMVRALRPGRDAGGFRVSQLLRVGVAIWAGICVILGIASRSFGPIYAAALLILTDIAVASKETNHGVAACSSILITIASLMYSMINPLALMGALGAIVQVRKLLSSI